MFEAFKTVERALVGGPGEDADQAALDELSSKVRTGSIAAMAVGYTGAYYVAKGIRNPTKLLWWGLGVMLLGDMLYAAEALNVAASHTAKTSSAIDWAIAGTPASLGFGMLAIGAYRKWMK